MRTFLFGLPLLVPGLIGFAVSAAPSPAQNPYCGSTPVQVGVFDHGLLYHHGAGLEKDLLDELARRTGCSLQSQLMTRSRIWKDLATGQLDLTVFGLRTPERERFARFIPYMRLKNHAILPVRLAPVVKNAADFLARPELRLGVVSAYRYSPQLDEWITRLRAQGRIEESPTVEALFLKLHHHRIDALLAQSPVYRPLLQELGLEKETMIQDWTPKEETPAYNLVLTRHRFSEVQTRQWSLLLDTLLLEGTLRKIYARYLLPAEIDQILDF